MTTKQDVADYINSHLEDALDDTEIAHLQEKVDPYLAQALIKVVGDVSRLIEIRDNISRNETNRNG
jgi:hypothetical protein|tara:strand:+ start:357 stop:554 length:198 start_codon:yes stop_codon:yes gene_type:complete